jgi:hypothetical protein
VSDSESIEANPLQLPLTGGSDAATVSVRPLLTGELAVPPAFYDRPSNIFGRIAAFASALRGPKPTWGLCPVPVFMV